MASNSSDNNAGGGILHTPEGYQTASGRARQQQSQSSISGPSSAFDNRRAQSSTPDNLRRPSSATVQLSQPLFILKGPYISPEEAVLFKTQALRVPDTRSEEHTS